MLGYTITGSAGVNTLTLDYTQSGGYFQKDVTYNASGLSGDTLEILGGAFGDITFNPSTAHNGTIQNYSDLAATHLLNTITYTGLTPLVDTGSAGNIVFNLPAGPNSATLGDNGTIGDTLSRLSSSPVTFEQTDFANPTNSLTINRGNATDTLAIDALPDFTAGLTVGSSGSPFATVSVNGNVTLTTGTANLALNGGAISLASGTATAGNINLTATTGAITETAGSLSTTGTLTTSSATGTDLANANTVTSFNASNSVSNPISLTNTIGTLTVTGITQTPGANVSVTNNGNLTTSTNPITTGSGGDISLQATGGVLTVGAAVTAGGGGTVGLTSTGGTNSVLVQAAISSTSGNITVNAAGAITESGAGQVCHHGHAIDYLDDGSNPERGRH